MVNGKKTSGAYLQPGTLGDRNLQIRGLGDLDRDTHTDLLWQDQRTGALTAWLMNGTTRLRAVAIPAIALPAPSCASTGRQRRRAIWQVRGLADINRDGHDDIVWHHPQSGDLYVWFMNGTTPTAGAAFTPGRFADTHWQLRGLADFNGDGQVDLLWHNQTTGDIYVWFMNGTTAIGAVLHEPQPLRGHPLAARARRGLQQRRQARPAVASPDERRPLRLVHERADRGDGRLPGPEQAHRLRVDGGAQVAGGAAHTPTAESRRSAGASA